MKKIIIPCILILTLSSCAPTYLSSVDSRTGNLTTKGMDSPCQNPKLLELEEKKTLTSEEMQTYLALRKMCEDRMNAAAIEYQLNQSANAHSYFMYQSLLSTVAAVIIVFAIE